MPLDVNHSAAHIKLEGQRAILFGAESDSTHVACSAIWSKAPTDKSSEL